MATHCKAYPTFVMIKIIFFVFVGRAASAEVRDSPMKIPEYVSELSVVEAQQLLPGILQDIIDPTLKDGEDAHPEIAWIKGLVSYSDGDFESSIRHYTSAIDYNPRSAELYWLRAQAYSQLMSPLALEDCRQAIAIDASFAPAHLLLAAVRSNHGADAESVLRILRDYRAQHDSHGDICYEKYVEAAVHLKDGNPETAIDLLNESLAGSSTYIFTDASEIWLLKSIAYEMQGEIALAIYSARRANEADRRAPRPLQQLWTLCRSEEHYFKALTAAMTLSKLDPSNVEFRSSTLMSYVDLEQWEAADVEAQAILAIDPENNLAQEYREQYRIAKEGSDANH